MVDKNKEYNLNINNGEFRKKVIHPSLKMLDALGKHHNLNRSAMIDFLIKEAHLKLKEVKK